ncbi:hypothetical protein C5167_046564 [Papaver somniferum]|uniref:Ubiquitin-like protein ATG12 n=1 Tax=Papaver somniferum TaxID=3469 RepID=A0A4Y7LI05_PAPSO|nr:hypothetical protein C5167_046564 [Papaver somniferum]
MATESPNSSRKVVVHLRATGDTPILKQAKFKFGVELIQYRLWGKLPPISIAAQIVGTHKFAKFMYVNSAFSPNPDELNFGSYGKLVVNYACSMARAKR